MNEHRKQRQPSLFSIGTIALWCGLILFIGTVILSLLARIMVTGSIWATVGITASVVIGYLLLFHWFNRPLSRRIYGLALLFIALGSRVVWVLVVDTQPVSDFKVLYDYAIKAADGDFAFGKMDYYIRWVYQLGYTLYEGLIVRIFGPSLVPLKLFNVLFETLTVWIVYRMGASLFGETSGRIAGLMYATYIPNIIMCSVLTNQHLSTLLFAAGCLIAVTHRGRNGVFGIMTVALCFALGSVFRPMGSFYVGIFILFLFLYEWTKSGSWQRRLGTLTRKGLSFIAVYFLVQQLISYSLITAGITDLKLSSNQEPYWKFIVGLNAESNGQWNPHDAEYVVKYPLGPERNQVELTLLKERLSDPVEVSALLLRKLVLIMAKEDDSVHWSLGGLDQYEWQIRLLSIERSQYMAYAFFGCFSLFALLFHKRISSNHEGLRILVSNRRISVIHFPLLLLLAYTVLHTIIEFQVRYRLDVMPFFIVFAGYGCVYLSTGLQNRIFSRRLSQRMEQRSDTIAS